MICRGGGDWHVGVAGCIRPQVWGCRRLHASACSSFSAVPLRRLLNELQDSTALWEMLPSVVMDKAIKEHHQVRLDANREIDPICHAVFRQGT